MPVLMIALASVLVFIAVMVLLAMAALAEYGQMQRIRFDPAARPFSLSLTEAFDPEHAILWGTQIPALLLVSSAGGRGLAYNRLYHAYLEAARHYPELYEGSSFAQWLFFLEQNELVTLTSYRVRITGYGREFLKHCLAETAVAA